ncbi:MAG: hypothetical protein AAB513_03120 [Patescibacteria group bacterium]
MLKRQENKGFTFLELFFWFAVITLVVGGFIYKRTNEIKKNPSSTSQQVKNNSGGIFGDLKSETESKQKLIEDN